MICIPGLQLLIMITNLNFFENIHMKHEAVAEDYQVLLLHTCMSMFSASFPASEFDVTLTGMPNFEVISRLFVFDVGHSSLVVPIKGWRIKGPFREKSSFSSPLEI